MNVRGHATDAPADWTAPYPTGRVGVKLRLLAGDVMDPVGGQWFGPNYPRNVIRLHCPVPVLPFVSVGLGRFGFYAGFKVYGVDSPNYREWMPAGEVFNGSRAMCLSIRFTANRRVTA